jgi:hypothetical protein
MGSLFEFCWKVGSNPPHSIPEGAAICFEGGFCGLRFEADTERDPATPGLKVTDTALRLKVSEPGIYWQVGDGDRHYIPDGAKVLTKIHKNIGLSLFLQDSICRMGFTYGKMKSGRRVDVYSDSDVAWRNHLPVWHYFVEPRRKGLGFVSSAAWNLSPRMMPRLSKAS